MKVKVITRDRITQEVFREPSFDSIEEANDWIEVHRTRGLKGKAHGRYRGPVDLPKKANYNALLIDSEYEKEISPAWSEQIYNKDHDGNFVLDDNGEKVPVLDGAGQPLIINHPAEKEMWVKLLPEYEVEIVDITAEVEAREAARLARLEELTEIRGMIDDINNSDLKPWLKKLLKRLVRELKD